MNRKRFNLATLFGIIASSLLLLSAIVCMVLTLPPDAFAQIFDELLRNPVFGEMINEAITPEVPLSIVATIFYIVFIVFNVLSALMAIPALVLSLINQKDKYLSVDEFQKRNKVHIGLLITFGIGYLGNSYSMISIFDETLSILSTISIALFIVGFIFALKEILFNKKVYDAQNNSVVDMVTPVNNNVTINENGNVVLKKKNENDEVKVVEEKEIVEDIKADNDKLNEVYELLSKLEKSYKNGEISEEDYKRMKETILKNYLNN